MLSHDIVISNSAKEEAYTTLESSLDFLVSYLRNRLLQFFFQVLNVNVNLVTLNIHFSRASNITTHHFVRQV